jgi:two-component system, LytTR family, sensor kinase
MMKNSSIQYLGVNDLWFRFMGIPIVGAFIPLVFFNQMFGTKGYWINLCFSIFYTTLYWHICRYFFIKGNAKFPDIKDNKVRLSWILGLCFAFIFTICNLVHFCIEPYFSIPIKEVPKILQINAASFVSFLVIASMYESMRYLYLLKKTLVEKERLERENVVSQLEGLKNQVNPHFLFNSLNTLIHIIPDHPDTAVRFVQKLSKVYRYILEIRDTNTTPLSNELEFLKAYIFLLKERFGENLHVNIHNMEGMEERHIAPLSLQILFENAIKHNIISSEKTLIIDLFIEGEKLIVKNNLQRKNQVQEGTGVGLENIKNRYQLISKKDVAVIITAQSFMVALPLLDIDKIFTVNSL